jgi:predicted alpha/beta hydrolase family esterase
MRIVIVHGAYGNPNENWFPWLRDELSERGHEVIVPALPTPEGQSLTSWKRAFEQSVGALDQTTVVVGHSAGATFILRLLENQDEPILAAILVSAFTGDLGLPEFDEINATLGRGDFAWDHIRDMAKTWRLYTSDDDPYVPFAKPTLLSEKLGIPITLIKGGKHLNRAAGYAEFPALRDDILAICAAAERR